jgi:hypothetical protein
VPRARAIWLWGAALVALAFAVRVVWVLAVPTVPVSDFAMYRESANYLAEFGRLDPGFIYMPGFVALLAMITNAGGDLLAQKLLGVAFGTLGAAAMFVLAFALVDRRGFDRYGDDGGVVPIQPSPYLRICPCPLAALSTFMYALWPAGIAMTSVVGTDTPAAALEVSALALLAALAPRRPWLASACFGVVLGLAAWVRAVALPLSVLALGFWLARRVPWRRALAYTAIGVASSLLVLLPWGLRHLRDSGSLYFADDHGGITALIGANPNSEGTYTRALNRLFIDVTGRTVLAEPHHETDRLAYGIAREWILFEPRYSLGLAISKLERFFDREQHLLYWPIYRPGVLLGSRARWFGAHRDAIEAGVDGFGRMVEVLALAGLATAAARRRWTLLSLVPFAAALTATYAVFFAEPRYRMPVEMLAFPFAALALAELVATVGVMRKPSRDGVAGAMRGIAPGVALVLLWCAGWPAIVRAGQALRARHRWAAIEADVDGGTRVLLWRPAAPFDAPSPISGAPSGVHLRVTAGHRARAQVRLGGGPLPPGDYLVDMRATVEAPVVARFSLSNVSADLPPQPTRVAARVAHPGGAFELATALDASRDTSVWIDDVRVLRGSPTP